MLSIEVISSIQHLLILLQLCTVSHSERKREMTIAYGSYILCSYLC